MPRKPPSDVTPTSYAVTEAIAPSGRRRQKATFHRDLRIVEEFALRYPEGGGAQEFILAAKATGFPFRSEATIRKIQHVLIEDGLLISLGRNAFRAPDNVVEQVKAGKRTIFLEKLPDPVEANRRRTRLTAQIHRMFPPPSRFRAAQVFEKIPELRSKQNAYGFLRAMAKRGEAAFLGEGTFSLNQSTVSRDPVTSVVDGKSSDSTKDTASDIERLYELVGRYQARHFYSLREVLVPIWECRQAIYGDELDWSNRDVVPPPCIVIGTHKAAENVLGFTDIDVMWLDCRGQVHLKAAASWMFTLFRRSSEEPSG